jgi:hypothetical protein
VLVQTPGLQSREEFEAIAAKVAARADDIEVFVVNNNIPNAVSRRQAARLPTFVFSPVPLKKFRPERGRVRAGYSIRKVEEARMMREGGIAVPDAQILEPDTKLDAESWGSFSVLKPSRGMGGHGVRLTRTRDVRWVDPQSWPRDDARFGVPLIVQKFVDTGEYTTCHKVEVMFGRTIWSTTSRQANRRPYILDPLARDPLDQPIAANEGERTVTLNYDREILDFGASIAPLFPDVPVLGIDVVREAATGRLYALEVNAGGVTWHTSSNVGLVLQRVRQIDLVAQFGALDIAADALVDVTRREAQ